MDTITKDGKTYTFDQRDLPGERFIVIRTDEPGHEPKWDVHYSFPNVARVWVSVVLTGEYMDNPSFRAEPTDDQLSDLADRQECHSCGKTRGRMARRHLCLGCAGVVLPG